MRYLSVEQGGCAMLSKLILDLMSKEISDEYYVFTNYLNVLHDTAAKKNGMKSIYLAHDSESKVFDNRGWLEAEHLTKVKPHLIISVSKIAHEFYEGFGLNSYYMPMGYDDENYKDYKIEKNMDVGFAGTIDLDRTSIFFPRYLYGSEITAKFPNSYFSNHIIYKDLCKLYSHAVIGWNDVARWTNQRCYEIPSGGAFMLVNETIRDTDFPLKEGKHYMVYNGVKDVLKKIEYLLDDREGTIKMGQASKKEILKHPQSRYVKEMIKKCNLDTLT